MSLSQQIDSIIGDAIDRHVFPGAVVLVAAAGRICHHRAYGTTMYGAPGSQPVYPDTIYDVASLTKLFTATAALRLCDAGKIELHAPISAYLPGLRAGAVTAWHLLTHTSGLDIRLSTLRHGGRARVWEAVSQLEPAHPPGTTVAYTNVNSLLLGELVAARYGAPLDQALQELVIGPLGLSDTSFLPSPELLPRIAPTEVDESWRGGLVHGTVHDESAHALGGIAGHAGLFSTASDLLLFCRAWLDALGDDGEIPAGGAQPNHLLHPATARQALTNQTIGLHLGCGMGWMIDRPNFMGAAPAGSAGHTGFTGPAVVLAHMAGIIVVVLSNRVYPKRGLSAHHPVIAAIVSAALCHKEAAGPLDDIYKSNV
jgi:CubicO group peptidase (beta-lactamase class C family)